MSIKLLRYAFVIVACIIHAWFVEAVGLNKLSVKISLHSYEILLWVWPIWGVVLWLCWKNVWAVAIPVIVGLIFIGPCYFGWMFGHSDSSFGLMPNKSPEPTPIAASGHSITPVVLIVSGSGWLSFFR